jgi:ABC-type lipoprotein export system ATPase subunit
MQRVAIARALAHTPAILIADEPTGNLDTASGEIVLQLIRRAAREFGAAVVIATHSAEAAAIADIRIHMRDGLIESVE